MGSVNKAILVGNLGKDAEKTTTASGISIARFSLATAHRRKNSATGDWEERTEWHRVVLIGKQADALQRYLLKGKQVYVEGRIENRSWDDKTTGQKRYMTEIIADTIQLLGGAGGGRGRDEDYAAGYEGAGEPGGAPRPAESAPDDDIPF
jgi:single-strand DNA-binding protein